jgi:hypothetical protein
VEVFQMNELMADEFCSRKRGAINVNMFTDEELALLIQCGAGHQNAIITTEDGNVMSLRKLIMDITLLKVIIKG